MRGGFLTVRADGIAMGAILEEIEKQGNIIIRKDKETLDQKLTIQFGPLPLDKGLKRLLKGTNYLATFDQKGNILSLVVCGNKSATSLGYAPPMETPIFPEEATQLESEEPEDNAAPPDPNTPPPGDDP